MLQKDHHKIREAAIKNGRPTFQTLCCFIHESPLPNSKETLELGIQSSANEEWNFEIPGFSEYVKTIVSDQGMRRAMLSLCRLSSLINVERTPDINFS